MRARAVVALGFVATLDAVGICAGVWATTDFSSTSTAPLALFFIPGWGLGATIVIWLLVWGKISRMRREGLPPGSDERARDERLRWEVEQRLWRESRRR